MAAAFPESAGYTVRLESVRPAPAVPSPRAAPARPAGPPHAPGLAPPGLVAAPAPGSAREARPHRASAIVWLAAWRLLTQSSRPSAPLSKGCNVRHVMPAVPGIRGQGLGQGHEPFVLGVLVTAIEVGWPHRAEQRDPTGVQRVENGKGYVHGRTRRVGRGD